MTAVSRLDLGPDDSASARKHFHHGLLALQKPTDAEGRPTTTHFAEWLQDADQVPPEVAYMVGQEGVQRAMRRIHDLAEEAGVPVVLLRVLLPEDRSLARSDEELMATDSHAFALRTAEALGFTVIDTVIELKHRMKDHGLAKLDLQVSSSDEHPNARGHALIAKILWEGLRDHALLPP